MRIWLFLSPYPPAGNISNDTHTHDRVSRFTNRYSQTTKYCYDGDQVIAEYDVNDTLLRKFIYGPGIDEPICMIVVDGESETRYYYHFDGLGSVAALSNNSGEIVERYEYDVFGRPDRVSDVNNPYFFTGRRYDDEIGLYYYRARYYDPYIGRFLQPDPIAQFLQLASTQRPRRGKIPGTYMSAQAVENFLQDDPIGRFLLKDPAGRFLIAGQNGFPVELNLYTYCGNNPINFVDPWGRGGIWDWLKRHIPLLDLDERMDAVEKNKKKRNDIIDSFFNDTWSGDEGERIRKLQRENFVHGVKIGIDLIQVVPGTTANPIHPPVRP